MSLVSYFLNNEPQAKITQTVEGFFAQTTETTTWEHATVQAKECRTAMGKSSEQAVKNYYKGMGRSNRCGWCGIPTKGKSCEEDTGNPCSKQLDYQSQHLSNQMLIARDDVLAQSQEDYHVNNAGVWFPPLEDEDEDDRSWED